MHNKQSTSRPPFRRAISPADHSSSPCPLSLLPFPSRPSGPACQSGGHGEQSHAPSPHRRHPPVSPAHLGDCMPPCRTREFPIPAIDVSGIDQKFLAPRKWPTRTGEGARNARRRYRRAVSVSGSGKTAARCATASGVGREGLAWKGRADINMKREWPPAGRPTEKHDGA